MNYTQVSAQFRGPIWDIIRFGAPETANSLYKEVWHIFLPPLGCKKRTLKQRHLDWTTRPSRCQCRSSAFPQTAKDTTKQASYNKQQQHTLWYKRIVNRRTYSSSSPFDAFVAPGGTQAIADGPDQARLKPIIIFVWGGSAISTVRGFVFGCPAKSHRARNAIIKFTYVGNVVPCPVYGQRWEETL